MPEFDRLPLAVIATNPADANSIRMDIVLADRLEYVPLIHPATMAGTRTVSAPSSIWSKLVIFSSG